LGATGLELSAIGLGGAWLGHDVGNESDVTRARAVIDAAVECGIGWVDTSENYFDTGNESVIGAALRSVSASFLVCSKVAPVALKSGGASGFRPEQVRAACEGSLRRLGRDHVDLYLLHWPDRGGVPLADTWGAMAGLVDDGLVRAIGMSNYGHEDIARCHRERPVDVIQDGLSVIDYLDQREKFAWCGQQGIAVTIYEPLANGILTDTPFEQVRERWIGSAWEDLTVYPELLCLENASPARQIVAGLRQIGERMGATVAQVALAWVLRQPGITSAIVGSGSPERTRSNAVAGDLSLPVEALQTIEEDLIPLTARFAAHGVDLEIPARTDPPRPVDLS
jgi:aryl-alcohol dehydrogenase-like predicted oxidoreductase